MKKFEISCNLSFDGMEVRPGQDPVFWFCHKGCSCLSHVLRSL